MAEGVVCECGHHDRLLPSDARDLRAKSEVDEELIYVKTVRKAT